MPKKNMKVTYKYGVIELEQEDARDETWMEDFIDINKDHLEFGWIKTEDGEWKKFKDYVMAEDIVSVISIGEI